MTAKAQPYLAVPRKDAEKHLNYGIIYFAFIQAMAIPPA
jgi:hypothetical protein